MTEWVYRGQKFKRGIKYDDGTEPALLMEKWVPFINDCILLLDGDGTFRHWKYAGALADQPYVDIVIYRIIQGKWVELRNEDMKKNMPSANRMKKGLGRRRR